MTPAPNSHLMIPAAAIFNADIGINQKFGDALANFAYGDLTKMEEIDNKYLKDISARYREPAQKVYDILLEVVQGGKPSTRQRSFLTKYALTVVEAIAAIRDFGADALKDESVEASENLRNSALTIRQVLPGLFDDLAKPLKLTLKGGNFNLTR